MKKPQADGFVDAMDPLHQQLAELTVEQLRDLANADEEMLPPKQPPSKTTSSPSTETEEDAFRAEALRRSRVRQLSKVYRAPTPSSSK
jgi:hypothetical protein